MLVKVWFIYESCNFSHCKIEIVLPFTPLQLGEYRCMGGGSVSTKVISVHFSRLPTVEHVSKGLISIKKGPVKKESSHSKYFGQLCKSST